MTLACVYKVGEFTIKKATYGNENINYINYFIHLQLNFTFKQIIS